VSQFASPVSRPVSNLALSRILNRVLNLVLNRAEMACLRLACSFVRRSAVHPFEDGMVCRWLRGGLDGQNCQGDLDDLDEAETSDLRWQVWRQWDGTAFRLRLPGQIHHCAVCQRGGDLLQAQCENRVSWVEQNRNHRQQVRDGMASRRRERVREKLIGHLIGNRGRWFQTALAGHRPEMRACCLACPIGMRVSLRCESPACNRN